MEEIHGVALIGNYGCALSSKLFQKPHSNPTRLSPARTGSRLGTVLSSVREQTAMDAPMRTNALNVMVFILPKIVLFVGKIKPSLKPPRLPNPRPPQELPNNLPTTVKVDRRSFLLSGYNPSIKDEIIFGFQFGFRSQEIYCLPCRILM